MMTKLVDGERVELTPEEEASRIEEEILSIKDRDANLFKMKRMEQYPSAGEQLEMIWDEIEANGAISKTGAWHKAIKKVKDDNPKPKKTDQGETE